MIQFVERTVVWAGGAAFVASLAFCAYTFAVRWGDPGQPGRVVWANVALNATLFSAFAAHHSLFARDLVKRWVARRVPDRLTRTLYVWIASLLLAGVVAAWRDAGGTVYHMGGVTAYALAIVQLTGVWLSVRSVRAIDALDLAGIRPISRSGGLQVAGPYHLVRHPLYLGWILIVFGAPHMTADRLVFATVTTVYLIAAIPWEERSLERAFGRDYAQYRALVRWRVLPFIY